MKIKINKNEKILAVGSEFAGGPGWSNTLVIVYIGDYSAKTFREVYIQPDNQTDIMLHLFSINASCQSQLIHEIEKLAKKVK